MAKATAVRNRRAATLEEIANMEFGDALTDRMRKKVERHAQLPCHGQHRRLGLAVMARTKAQLVDGFGDGELLDEMCDRLSGYVKHLEGQLEIMRAAQARTMCVLATLVVRAEEKASGRRRKQRDLAPASAD